MTDPCNQTTELERWPEMDKPHVKAWKMPNGGVLWSNNPPIRLTPDSLPPGNFWEEDGCCWQYERDNSPRGWRMKPMNVKAFTKRDPAGSMFDYYPRVGKLS